MELHCESLQLSQSIGDQAGIARALVYLGRINTTRGDYLQADRDVQAGLGMFRAIGDEYGLVIGLRSLAEIRFDQDEYAAGIALLHEALVLNNRFGDKYAIGWTWFNLGYAAQA